MEEKLTWTFALYDINGDGCVSREEMTEIVSAIYDMVDNRPTMSLADGTEPQNTGAVAVPGGAAVARVDGEWIKQKVDQIFQVSGQDVQEEGEVK